MIDIENVGKAFRKKSGEITWVFRHLDARFQYNTNIGILGASGSGKTTLINLITGNETPSEGRIVKRASFSWPYSFRGNVSAKLSGIQNTRFLAEVYGRDFGQVHEFICDFGELGRVIELPMRRWTQEQRNRYSVSALLGMGFDCIVIDDDIAIGDGAFRRRVVQFFADNRDEMCMIIATADPSFLPRFCDVGVVLDHRGLTVAPSIDAAIEQYNLGKRAIA
ncbi:ATP-binding cassette domain-containing protein [Rhizobium alvei]|uniref:ATP-binding cassette domain-containing protein n=1 Tax=Rhizobium alvei TaxID=1132659 RepID=A0ABT8YHF4_9HYPH|nr:ATP-binding cassette domain-containing protein [Rhizobium alvei]MDO6962694.1 ATP-binding cassette domain-containing protein [Rhizobium alvei]